MIEIDQAPSLTAFLFASDSRLQIELSVRAHAILPCGQIKDTHKLIEIDQAPSLTAFLFASDSRLQIELSVRAHAILPCGHD